MSRIQAAGWRVGAAAAAAGVSRRTAHKWLARYRVGGAAALADRGSRPQRSPRRTAPAVVAAIVQARYQRRTAWAIAVALQVPRSTVAVILARQGLNRVARLTPPPPVQRYERAHPGELLHLDIKALGRIVRGAQRAAPGRRGSVGAGWEYVHVAIDDYSRVAYVEVRPNQTGPTTARFLGRAVTWFQQRGVRIRAVLSDNGGAYRSQALRALAQQRGLRLYRTRPYRPQTNGKAERFIQTLLREWAYAAIHRDSAHRARRLTAYLAHYNGTRPHAALGYRPPCARLPRATV